MRKKLMRKIREVQLLALECYGETLKRSINNSNYDGYFDVQVIDVSVPLGIARLEIMREALKSRCSSKTLLDMMRFDNSEMHEPEN